MPLGLGHRNDLVLPLAAGEACWIGLDASTPGARLRVTLAVQTAEGTWLDALGGTPWQAATADSVVVPTVRCIACYRHTDGALRVFARDGANPAVTPCQRLRLRVSALASAATPLEVTIRLLPPAAFASESGLPAPAPLDPTAGYRGWRLP